MNPEQIALKLWQRLWQDYRCRVEYARLYEQMIQEAGGIVVNDHIAFRSLRLVVKNSAGKTNLGIPYIARIAIALGYEVAGEYEFPDCHLYAHHYRHPAQDRFDLPKLFISELIVDELPASVATQIAQTVSSGRYLNLQTNKREIAQKDPVEQAVDRLQTAFIRPWDPPKRSVVEAVNAISQYGAWVLLHGYAPNHFTGYVNRQQTPDYPDIETTARGLAELGVPMKTMIEGRRGSGLWQTATQAATEKVWVRDDISDTLIQIPWPYAYYEIAERNWVEMPGKPKVWFDGFLSPQARNLFEMTRQL